MNVLTDCVNLQGDKDTTSKGPTSNFLLKIISISKCFGCRDDL